ncbi:pentapeptide repeat-containing protein [Streptomyces sp. NPDC020607]|uniref:pentapeptide repeat-containing protein n=1 Tax=Streptomyces sp. NPDC020607 TaxID=3365082 RepID=UPI0037977ED2
MTPSPPGDPAPPDPAPSQGSHCDGGADPACRGRIVSPHQSCLAHLDARRRQEYFAGLRPGDAVDHRDTALDAELLARLLHSVRDPATGRPTLGTARFEGAGFTGVADFGRTTFTRPAYFNDATFHRDAEFTDTSFEASAFFGGARFIHTCDFAGATFAKYAGFRRAEFGEWAGFESVIFRGTAGFLAARFGGQLALPYTWVYGEMEMRRHSHSPRDAERWLLQAYWLLSGYGLRASRALGWLALAMTTTVLLLMGFGLPGSAPALRASGTLPSDGGPVTFEIDQEAPRNPAENRFTSKRFEKALRVTLDSVVFRSSGQDLTTTGAYVEMASRFTEPVLLGLGALAVRGRIKR